jgi:hypothetical protein
MKVQKDIPYFSLPSSTLPLSLINTEVLENNDTEFIKYMQ